MIWVGAFHNYYKLVLFKGDCFSFSLLQNHFLLIVLWDVALRLFWVVLKKTILYFG
jgi:hypothetical protein